MTYRKPLPEGTKVRMLRTVYRAKRGKVYTTRIQRTTSGESCILMSKDDPALLGLFGPDCIEQHREGHTWELVKDDQS